MNITYNAADILFNEVMSKNIFRFDIARSKEDVLFLNGLFKIEHKFNAFKRKVIEKYGNLDSEALKRNYYDALLICELGSSYKRFAIKKDIFPYFQVSIFQDRPIPKDIFILEGLILPSTHPAWNKIYPLNYSGDIGTWVRAKMKHQISNFDLSQMEEKAYTFINTDFFKESAEKGFGINRGNDELVIVENKRYLDSLS